MPVEDQASVGKWNLDTFGPTNGRMDLQAERFLEEAVELCAAAGCSPSSISMTVHQATEKVIKKGGFHPGRHDVLEMRKEAGDCGVVLMAFCTRAFLILAECVNFVMAINRRRAWKINADGVGQHVEE